MEPILTAVDTVTTLVGDIFTLITGNPLLATFVAASLIGTAITVFTQLRQAAR